jgi:hypothetical protein
MAVREWLRIKIPVSAAVQDDHSWCKHRVCEPWISTASKQKISNSVRYLETVCFLHSYIPSVKFSGVF